MILKVVAYKDTKLNCFTNPFYLGNISNEEIIETARRMCTNPQLPSVYLEYDLYLLGEFDDKVGKFKVCDPEFLVSMADFKHLAPVKEEEKVDVVG